MTDEQLTAIEQRANAAPPGPWRNVMSCANSEFITCLENDDGYLLFDCDTLDFVSHARTDVPALVAEVRRLRGALMQIANRPEAEMMTAVTLHYDMRGWALRALGIESVSRASIPVDARFAGLGREVVRWILDSEYWWDDERSEDIMPMLEQWGLAERVPYSIEQHGDNIEAEEGDEIWWIDPNKFSTLPTEITRLRADIERIGHERDQMVAANVELQERLSALEDDGK